MVRISKKLEKKLNHLSLSLDIPKTHASELLATSERVIDFKIKPLPFKKKMLELTTLKQVIVSGQGIKRRRRKKR